MPYEVELKFPLADSALILSMLDGLGATRLAAIEQNDRYFAHPVRDFADTDEALRIRSCENSNVVTYKGPIVDDRTKTRQEIEVPFAGGADTADQFAEMLTILGFHEVRTVSKERIPFQLDWEDQRVELSLDDVVGLPGSFIEIEILADESTRDAARDSILRLAENLVLKNPERRSYLRLLLDADS
jgi:adenylate cyclase class 2